MNFQFLFYSDTHLGFEFPFNPRSNHRHRGPDFFKNFHKVYTYAIDNKVQVVIHGGDLFYRSKIPAKLATYVYTLLQNYAARGIKMYIVPGNHERSYLPDSLLIQDNNIRIFKKPLTYCENVAEFPVAICGFPFVRENIRDNFRSLVSATGWQNSKETIRLLCLHQSIEGAKVGTHNFTFVSGPDVVRMNDIQDEFTVVLSGHIHRRQVLHTKLGAPVIYAGSVERTSFAERSEPKGFYHISINSNGVIEFINFIDLHARPMYEIDYTHCKSKNEMILQLKQHLEILPDNAVVRISSHHIISINEIRELAPDSMSTYFRLKSITPN